MKLLTFYNRFALLPPHSLTTIPTEITHLCFPAISTILSLERVHQFCACSLLHHTQWLNTLLPKTSAVLLLYAVCNYSVINPSLTLLSGIMLPILNGNGIPPHIQTWINESELKTLVNELPQKILDGMDVILERNGVGAGNITQGMLETMMRNLLETDQQNQSLPVVTPPPEHPSFYHAYMWQDGKFHKLPENFQVPDMTVLNGWLLW